jgi:two-component system nitrogen regulation response regulator NtrX
MVPRNSIEAGDLETSLRIRVEPEPVEEMEGTLREAREQFEKKFILHRLQETHWNITRAAERLGIERSNLHRKMKGYGIESPRD